ncbi:MAG TPA: glycosyltransferase family 1 protein [Myxococcales bacterium]
MTTRVAIDLRMLVEPPDGVTRYSLELLRRIPGLMPGSQVGALGRADAIRAHVPGARVLRARSRPATAAEQVELPWLLRRRRVDLFHATTFSAPFVELGCRTLLTLHDTIYLDLPGIYGRYLDRYFRTATRLLATRAAGLVTVSEFSRRQIERHFRIPAERVEVVPCGIDARFHPATGPEMAAMRGRLGLPEEFLLYVGGFVAHKNVPSLLRGYAKVKDAPPLVLCGRFSETLQPEIDRLGLAGRALTVPAQGHDTLPALYTAARAFLFPSRYEGFGLPPMEAMACGAPTIVSDAGSLPEVTGGAALCYPVDDEEALAQRIREVLTSDDKRRELAMAGRIRAAQFTWESAARRMAAIYRRLL